MATFQITKPAPVTLMAVNLPAKKKGQDIILTTDIVFELEGPNHEVLPRFDAQLLPMLYRPAEEGDKGPQRGQATLEGVDAVSKLPLLRTAALKMPMPLVLEFTGYTLTVDRGLGDGPAAGSSNIVVDEATIKSIRLWAKEGGTVRIVMHVQSKNVSDEQVGQLRGLLKRRTEVTLIAPKLQQDIDLEAGQRAAAGEKVGDRKVTAPRSRAAAPAPAPAAAKPAKKPSKEDTARLATEEFTKLAQQQGDAGGTPAATH